MSRTPLAFTVADATAFARHLGRALADRHAAGQRPPGHVELLNLMARALGHRNLQALQADARAAASAPAPDAPAALTLPAPALAVQDRPPPAALSAHARKALMQFDSRGRLVRWPNKFTVQRLAMWVLWTHFDGRRVYTEREVNRILEAANAFGDHVTLRRELVNHKLLQRKSDCSEYRKVAARPDDEARALLTAWRAQQRLPGAHGPRDWRPERGAAQAASLQSPVESIDAGATAPSRA